MEHVANELPHWFLLAFFVGILFIIGIVINNFLSEWIKTRFKSAKKGTRFEDQGGKPWVDRFIDAQDKAAEVGSNQITMLANLHHSMVDVIESQKELAKLLVDRTPTLAEMYRILSMYDEGTTIHKYLKTKIERWEQEQLMKKKPDA